MNLMNTLKKHYGKILLGLFALWLINLFFFAGNFSFKEEVKLSSGEVIVVYRHFKTSPLGEIGGSGGWEAKYNSFEIVSPELSDMPPKWESKSGLVPLLFDRHPKTNEWFLVVTSFMCNGWKDIGPPEYHYAEFRIANGRWKRVPLSPELIGRSTNVYTSMRSSGEFWPITLEKKRLRSENVNIYPPYKSILTDWSSC